jgi:hypothetical protein
MILLDEAGGLFFNGPGRRETAGGRSAAPILVGLALNSTDQGGGKRRTGITRLGKARAGHGLDQASRPSRPTAGSRAFGPAGRAPFASPLFISRNCNNADTLASRTLATTHFSALPGFVPSPNLPRPRVHAMLTIFPTVGTFTTWTVRGMGWRPSLGLTFYFYLMICIGVVTGVTHKWINSSTDHGVGKRRAGTAANAQGCGPS